MAEGYLRYAAPDGFEALSAGLKPRRVNALAIEVMREIGIDISLQVSKDVVTLLGQFIPYVVTLCESARERCPIFPQTYKFLHWNFDDPAAVAGTKDDRLREFRRVRDEIIKQIDQEFIKSDAARKPA